MKSTCSAVPLRLLIATCCLICLACGSSPAQAGVFIPLGTLPDDSDKPGAISESQAVGISANGSVVVGSSGSQAFRWTQETGMVALADQTHAIAVSSDGSVVLLDGKTGPSRWTAGGGVESIYGTDFRSDVNDLSAGGSIVVGSLDSQPKGKREATIWMDGVEAVRLGILSDPKGQSTANGVSADGTVVVGFSTTGTGTQAFRWTELDGMIGLGQLPGGSSSEAMDVSADGSVIVGHASTDLGTEAFRWTEAGGMVGLGDLPGGIVDSIARAVSADGSVIVGRGVVDDLIWEAFRWTEAGGMQSVQEQLTGMGLDLTGWELWEASGVSADGNIVVGYGQNPDGYMEAWLADFRDSGSPAVVPEASSLVAWSILMIVCSATCWWRRRQHRVA